MTIDIPKIAVIGGGTGSAALLEYLKELTPEITAIPCMSDDGGSTGIIRTAYGGLPVGDVRQCLVALANNHDAKTMFNYRYPGGPFEGHSVGNIILSAMQSSDGTDINGAIRKAAAMLNITGRVVPVTLEPHRLGIHDGGETVFGEFVIGHRKLNSKRPRIFFDPHLISVNPEAAAAIREADAVVIAPGNLYGSLLPALAVSGVGNAIRSSKAVKIMVGNIMNKPGQTDDWHAADYIREIESYIGEGSIDIVLCSRTVPERRFIERYAEQGAYPVKMGASGFHAVRAKPVFRDIIHSKPAATDPNDKLVPRTQIKHDGAKLADAIVDLVHEPAYA